MKQNVLKNTLLQILLWGALWTLMIYILSFDMPRKFGTSNRILGSLIIISLAITVNLNYLLPKLYFKNKILTYIIGCIGLFAFIAFLSYFNILPSFRRIPNMLDISTDTEYFRQFRNKFPRPSNGPRLIKYIELLPPFFVSIFGSTIIELSKFAHQKEIETAKLESEKLLTELKFLKAQINPHFLFNALNNVYALTVTKHDEAPNNLLKLSNMLRYMVYDCESEKVPLRKEIEYIKNYISLINLKDSEGLNNKIKMTFSDPNLMVPPLLLSPFIENAFKHSNIEDLENGWVEVTLKSENGSIDLKVSNSCIKDNFTKDAVGGVGLINVRKRLELLYDKNFSLKIKKDQDRFDVHLNISKP